MKQKIIKAWAVLMIVSLLPMNTNALPSSRAYNWFFKKSEGGAQPPSPAELSFIEDYSVRWIDRDVKENDKVIYLTFDVGYENGNVKKVLDTLGEHGAVGTFFILDNMAVKFPELVKRMANEGHVIGNHTAKHPDMTKICDKTLFAKQLTDLENCVREKTGVRVSEFFRPPEGRISPLALSYLESLGYKTVFWSFAYADWDNAHQPDPEKAFNNIISHTHNGMVILLHPTSNTNAEILPRLLDKWQEMGYRFGTPKELFGIK